MIDITYRNASRLNLILAIITLALVIFHVTYYESTNMFISIVTLILFITMFVISKKYFNCPNCNSHITREAAFNKVCPNCGEELKSELPA